jgi:IS30 family transposase
MLNLFWSPQQIARTLRSSWPNEPELHVSHETIYNAIYAYPRGELRKALIACLRQGQTTRRPRSGGTDRRGQIPEMVSIHVRPPEVENRQMPGHWEGDLIRGANNRSAVGVLVERTTRLVLLAWMPDATAESALAAFTAKLHGIAAPMRQTLTYDRGKEMARHRELARATNMRVYFCDPHSPWQRGSCENTNGLLRQFLPKGTDLSVHDQQALDSIADLMNNRPRETLGWRSPFQAFRELMQSMSEQAGSTIH